MLLFFKALAELLSLTPQELYDHRPLLILYVDEKPQSFDAQMEFSSIFENLTSLNGTIINCQAHQKHCKKELIKSIPQIVYMTQEYNYNFYGNIVQETIKAWLEKIQLPVLKEIESENDHIHGMDRMNINQFFILHTPESIEDAEQLFLPVRGRIQIAYLHRKCKPMLKAYRQGKTVSFYDLEDSDALKEFLDVNILPIFGKITKYNFDFIMNKKKHKTLFLVANLSNPKQKYLAQEFKKQILNNYNENSQIYEKYIFGYVNVDKNTSFMMTIPRNTPYFQSVKLKNGQLTYSIIESKLNSFDKVIEKAEKITQKDYLTEKKIFLKLLSFKYKFYTGVKIITCIIMSYTFVLGVQLMKKKCLTIYLNIKAKNKHKGEEK